MPWYQLYCPCTIIYSGFMYYIHENMNMRQDVILFWWWRKPTASDYFEAPMVTKQIECVQWTFYECDIAFSTYVWSFYITTHTLCQSLRNNAGFLYSDRFLTIRPLELGYVTTELRPLSSTLDDILLASRWMFLEKAEDAYPYRCTWYMLPVFSGSWVAHFFVSLYVLFWLFNILCLCICFQCLIFVPGLHSFDFRQILGSLDYSLPAY